MDRKHRLFLSMFDLTVLSYTTLTSEIALEMYCTSKYSNVLFYQLNCGFLLFYRVVSTFIMARTVIVIFMFELLIFSFITPLI